MSARELAKSRLASSVAAVRAEPVPNRAAPARTARDATGRLTGANTRRRWQAATAGARGKGRPRAQEAAWHVQAGNIAPFEVLY